MAEGPAVRPRRRHGFAPTVLAGVAAAVLTAVAAGRDWATASGNAAGVAVTARATGSSSAPLALSLALVALAAWGVVLVVRGGARRVVAVLGALAAAGVLATAVTQAGRARTDAVAQLVARGGAADHAATGLTGWYVVCVGGAALTLVALAVAVLLSPRWPGMGVRYDAPSARARADATPGTSTPGTSTGSDTGRDTGGDTGPPTGPGTAAATVPATEQDMWRALDAGRDPTE
jgi:uncharacterized membrane protein (TIGR02234 family)